MVFSRIGVFTVILSPKFGKMNPGSLSVFRLSMLNCLTEFNLTRL